MVETLVEFFSKSKNEISLSEFIEITKSLEYDSPLILFEAIKQGNIQICKFLLEQGIPWNSIYNEKSIGIVALENNHLELYKELVNFGTTSEFILTMAGQRVVEDGKLVDSSIKISNSEYLNRKLEYSKDGETLLDSDQNGIMMGWERPIMQVTVKHLRINGKRVLNIGFGLGIIDTLIQEQNPQKHTIIEAHPDVYSKMIQDGWDKKPNVEILFGRWQDVELGLYDTIYFDTFGEYYDDMKEFHENLPNILDESGQYSFFNGLAGTDLFFHDVACNICELDLRDMGFDVKFIDFKCGELDDRLWDDIKRAYWTLDIYRLPIVTFSS
jgi:protein arginine N-methyltransferase 2